MFGKWLRKKECKLVMTLLVRDEEDIIAWNIDFHRKMGVDFFIAMDNLSTDNTQSILRKYEKKGILKYIFNEEDNYHQTEWVTRMARLAYNQYAADWVINNDADEFWWPIGHNNLKDLLLDLPDDINVIEADRLNFVAVQDSSEEFFVRMRYRQTASLNPLGKALPPKVCHRGNNDVIVAQGNHSVSGLGDLGVHKGSIEILHYPLRSYRQYENKIIKGGKAYERNNILGKSIGSTWRILYNDYYLQGRLPEYYDKMLFTKGKIKQGLDRGDLVEDRRLAEFFI